jgi:hypothetical protein
MNAQDRQVKVLLALLVIGVWGLLLRPLLPATKAHAQKPKQREYMVINAYYYGYIMSDQAKLLNEYSAEGWRLLQAFDNSFILER